MNTSNTQQAWLASAYTLLRGGLLREAPEVDKVVLSYGFPKGSHGRRKAIGQCWHCGTKEGHSAIVFVHPCQWTSPLDVLHVLIHEMIHCAEPKAGHKKPFSQLAKRVGLAKPWTATTAGPELTARLNAEFLKNLPAFPAASFDASTIRKAATRLRLWECDCGVKVRVARDDFAATCNACQSDFTKQ